MSSQRGDYFDDFSDFPLDVNGDGFLDIVTGAWFGEKVEWRENPKGGTGPWALHEIAKVGNVIVDVDHRKLTDEWSVCRVGRGEKILDIVPELLLSSRSMGFSPCRYPQTQVCVHWAIGKRPSRPESQPQVS